MGIEMKMQEDWENCIENLGTFIIEYDKFNLCGASRSFNCPYRHGLSVAVHQEEGNVYFRPVCKYYDRQNENS